MVYLSSVSRNLRNNRGLLPLHTALIQRASALASRFGYTVPQCADVRGLDGWFAPITADGNEPNRIRVQGQSRGRYRWR